MSDKMLKIGAVSEHTGCSVATIRYYEKQGLVPAPIRAASGYRLYDTNDVQRLRLIKRCRSLGLGIKDVRNLLQLTEHSDFRCSDVKRLGEQHLVAVQAQIEQLYAHRSALKVLIARCNGGDESECGFIDTLLTTGHSGVEKQDHRV